MACLQAVGSVSEDDEALEQRLREAGLGRPLAHDDGSELAVVSDHDELLGAHDDGDEALSLHGLRRLVDQNLPGVVNAGGGRVRGGHGGRRRTPHRHVRNEGNLQVRFAICMDPRLLACRGASCQRFT